MHQYSRIFERYRLLSASRPVEELVSADKLEECRDQVVKNAMGRPMTDAEMERDLRTAIYSVQIQIFHKTQTETTQRWTFEQEIKRLYFHVTELAEPERANWHKYLDFEEGQGDYDRILFLYERCLVATAYYDEFWFRYARWMSKHEGKEEEVRHIYQRASFCYAPIASPAIRYQWALFEEMQGRVAVAKDIYEAIIFEMPSHVDAIIALANLLRRQDGLEAAKTIFKNAIESKEVSTEAKGAIHAEWGNLLYKHDGNPEKARAVFEKGTEYYKNVRAFWMNYLKFELHQPTSADTESVQHARIKKVVDGAKDAAKAKLPQEVVREIIHHYMVYLLERGGKDAAKEYLELEKDLNGTVEVKSNFSSLNGFLRGPLD